MSKIDINLDFKLSLQCRSRRQVQIVNIPKNATIDGNLIKWTTKGEKKQEYCLQFMNLTNEQREEIQKGLEECKEYLPIWM